LRSEPVIRLLAHLEVWILAPAMLPMAAAVELACLWAALQLVQLVVSVFWQVLHLPMGPLVVTSLFRLVKV